MQSFEYNFLSSDVPDTFWVVYPFLLAGSFQGISVKKAPDSVVSEQNEDGSLREITQDVSTICRRVEKEIRTFFCFGPKSKSALVTLSCVVRRLLSLSAADAVRYVKTVSLNFRKWIPKKDQLWLVSNYKPPIKVLFCGDRNSAICFERVITFELKALPEDSIVVHGGCKGVDLFTEELAKLAGIATKVFSVTPEEWNVIGLSAGPQRNQKMLEEGISYVMAFHPDIDMSKGTKDMMNRAWLSGIPVYIHDLKRKSVFEGDFNVL
jgi:hypothetical protein